MKRNRTEYKKEYYKNKSGAWKSWCCMKRRVKRDIRYKNIGIIGCWNVFDNFYRDMGDRPIGCSLDRIDNKGGYSKDNCRWSNAAAQARNRKNTKLTECVVVKIKASPLSVKEISKQLGLSYCAVWDVVKGRNWREVAHV